ncbi:MAG TPA: guanylate kinase [Actinomycetota bacterium]|nr:guanylate kinase [Actinomycetota bacterium]
MPVRLEQTKFQESARRSNSIAEPRLYIISGPSGAGKGTIVQRLLEERPDTRLSVSCTTRPARPMEKEGVHYFFISEREFAERRDRGEFLEWAEVHGNMYGTPRKVVDGLLSEGYDVILEIDVQGAAEVKSAMPGARLIFIEAPSMQILEQRLRRRSTELEDAQVRRLSDAYDELRKKESFDGVVVNVEVEQAVKEVLALMDSR